jgi:hypothetical protein
LIAMNTVTITSRYATITGRSRTLSSRSAACPSPATRTRSR